ncbi:protein lifeguard 2-like isoform X2 [Culicoides brevitarsis]|uniref:protein lifeguard 2-like isoform X2 n=1 Tax=Culicoides brevitarsis TaxID=469753 RepID=UPI00307C7B52
MYGQQQQQPGYGQPPQPGFYPHNQGQAAQPMFQDTNNNFSTDFEAQADNRFDFDDQTVRKAFIRKVYMILMVQLLITFGVIALFVFHEPTKKWTYEHPELFWIAFAVMIVTLISMACCTNVRRKTPMNFIFLFLFTLAEAFLLGVVSSVYDVQEVLMAVGLTAGVCLALTLFAFQTKWDFTVIGGSLCAATFCLLFLGIFAIIFPGKILSLVYASLGVVLFSVYLVYDTQLMMGGKHKYSISPEEYIFAALNLYLDIVNIFMYILTIIGASRS